MASVKYDVSDAEVRNFEVPKPGVYEAHIHEMSHGDSSTGNPMFTIVFEITKGEFKGSRVWHYILTDGSQDWRLREFTDALGLPSKGSLDPAKLTGTVVQIKTVVDPAKDGYDEKAKIKNVLPAAGTNGASAEGDEDEAPYDEWDVDDLKEEAEARQLEISGRKTKKKLVDALEASDAEEEGDEDEAEEDDEAEGADYTWEDLEALDRAGLKALIKDEELDVTVKRSVKDDQLRELVADALEIPEEDEEDEEEEEEPEPPKRSRGKGKGKAKKAEPEPEEDEDEDEDTAYEEWEVSELKAELKERGLKTDGRKSALVKRLEADDESDEEPF